MMKPASPSQETPIAILFPPRSLPIIDIFRSLSGFEEHYNVGTLDTLERHLCKFMQREIAKSVVSDALLLAFGLRRERHRPLAYRPIQSRRGTFDEYRLLALIGASYWCDFRLASEAAEALDVEHPQPLVSLAFDMARRFRTAGVELEAPDPRLVGPEEGASEEIHEPPGRTADPCATPEKLH